MLEKTLEVEIRGFIGPLFVKNVSVDCNLERNSLKINFKKLLQSKISEIITSAVDVIEN